MVMPLAFGNVLKSPHRISRRRPLRHFDRLNASRLSDNRFRAGNGSPDNRLMTSNELNNAWSLSLSKCPPLNSPSTGSGQRLRLAWEPARLLRLPLKGGVIEPLNDLACSLPHTSSEAAPLNEPDTGISSPPCSGFPEDHVDISKFPDQFLIVFQRFEILPEYCSDFETA